MSGKRNDKLFDGWSVVHLFSGIVLGWVMSPFVALILLVLWEPLEIFVFSPFLSQFKIVFGHETLKNSLSDIIFDTAGVIIGTTFLTMLFVPPFYFF